MAAACERHAWRRVAVPAAMASDAGNMVEQIGRPQAEHLQHAGQMVDGMPQPLLDAAREPFVAQAVIYALLLSRDDETTRTRQLQMLQAADRTAVVPGDAATFGRGPSSVGRGPAAAGGALRSRRSSGRRRSSTRSSARWSMPWWARTAGLTCLNTVSARCCSAIWTSPSG